MIFMGCADGDDATFSNPAEAVRFFDTWAPMRNPWGTPGNKLIFGPAGEVDQWGDPARATGPLQVDVDTDAGRAAARWLPDGTHSVDLPPAEAPIRGAEWGVGPTEIPAELARVSVDKAREVVEEYVTTGEKPTCVQWEAD